MLLIQRVPLTGLSRRVLQYPCILSFYPINITTYAQIIKYILSLRCSVVYTVIIYVRFCCWNLCWHLSYTHTFSSLFSLNNIKGSRANWARPEWFTLYCIEMEKSFDTSHIADTFLCFHWHFHYFSDSELKITQICNTMISFTNN